MRSHRTHFSVPLLFARAISILAIALSGFTQQEEILIQPPPGEERVEQMRQRLEETTDEGMRSTLLMQMLYQLQNLGAMDEAMEIYEEMLETPAFRNPVQQYQHLRNLGTFLETQGRSRDALKYYDRFLQSLPKGALPGQYESLQADIEARRLSALFSSGDYQSVKTAAFEILEATGKPVAPPMIEVLIGLGESDLLTLKDLDRLEDLLLSKEIYQFHLARLARLYVNQGRVDQAVAFLDRILERWPKAFLPLLDAAIEIYRLRFADQAENYLPARLDRLSEGTAADAITYDLIRARWLNRMGKGDEALALLEEKSNHSPLYLSELVSLYFEREKYAEAAAACQQLVRLAPNHPDYYRLLGEARFRQGDKEGAIQAWENIPRIQGASAGAYQKLAEIYQLRGLYEEAIAALQRAQKLPGGNPYELMTQMIALRVEIGDDEALLREYLNASMMQLGYEYHFRGLIVEQVADPERGDRLFAILQRKIGEYGEERKKDLLRRLGVEILIALNRSSQAVDFVQSTYATHPDRGRQLYQLGSDLLSKGAIESAVKAFGLTPPGDPYYAQARAEMARVSLEYGRHDEARTGASDLVRYLADRYPYPPLKAQPGVESSTVEMYLKILPRAEQQRLADALSILAQADLAQKRPGEALKWLLPMEKQPLPDASALTALLLGHAYSQLGSLETAEQYYQKALDGSPEFSPIHSEAQFYRAECLFWREKTPEAMDRYHELAQRSPQEKFTNDALRRYVVLTFAPAEQLYHYTLATLFDWKGDWDEAIRLFREAAADDAQGDVAGWCLYEAARIFVHRGMAEEAQKQIAHIIERYDHPTLQAECKVLVAQLAGPAPAPRTISDATGPWADLLTGFPDSLYSDLARLKLEGRLLEPF